jgi:hypothetical protein
MIISFLYFKYKIPLQNTFIENEFLSVGIFYSSFSIKYVSFEDYILDCATHTLAEVYKSAILMKFRIPQLSADFNIQYNSLKFLKLGDM